MYINYYKNVIMNPAWNKQHGNKMCMCVSVCVQNRTVKSKIDRSIYLYSQLNITKVWSQFNEIGIFFKQMALEQL